MFCAGPNEITLHSEFQNSIVPYSLGDGRGGGPLFSACGLGALLGQLPVPAGTEFPPITPALKLLSLIQPTVLLSLAVLIGVALASKIGLSSPAAEAVAGKEDFLAALKPQIIPGLIGGFLGGVGISKLVFVETISAAGLCGAERGIKQTASPANATALRRIHGGVVAALGVDDGAGVGGVAFISKGARQAADGLFRRRNYSLVSHFRFRTSTFRFRFGSRGNFPANSLCDRR
jgi:hypothetical protein